MTSKKPYFAVIFTSKLKTDEGYAEMAKAMADLAKHQDGFLGLDSARQDLGITVSYWTSLEAIASWKANIEHRVAQEKGKTFWYYWYNIKVCKVEREYEFGKPVRQNK